MKIGFSGVELPEGKVKFRDEKLVALQEKDNPKKVSPFFVEFIRNEFVRVDVIVLHTEKMLDILILDMEKIETRWERTEDQAEKLLMQRCMEILENEVPLCDADLSREERDLLKAAAPVTLKPVMRIEGPVDVNDIISEAIERADYMFFYTSGPRESHAWLVKKNSDILSCAAKIHSDLARGFIRGDVVAFEDYMHCHNFNECKSKGLARVVERDYIVRPDDIIEIRFNI
jgi:ribosome-binding ATPase